MFWLIFSCYILFSLLSKLWLWLWLWWISISICFLCVRINIVIEIDYLCILIHCLIAVFKIVIGNIVITVNAVLIKATFIDIIIFNILIQVIYVVLVKNFLVQGIQGGCLNNVIVSCQIIFLLIWIWITVIPINMHAFDSNVKYICFSSILMLNWRYYNCRFILSGWYCWACMSAYFLKFINNFIFRWYWRWNFVKKRNNR